MGVVIVVMVTDLQRGDAAMDGSAGGHEVTSWQNGRG